MSSFKKALVWSLDDTLLSFKEPFPLWQRPARFGTPGFQTSSSSSRVFGFQHVSTCFNPFKNNTSSIGIPRRFVYSFCANGSWFSIRFHSEFLTNPTNIHIFRAFPGLGSLLRNPGSYVDVILGCPHCSLSKSGRQSQPTFWLVKMDDCLPQQYVNYELIIFELQFPCPWFNLITSNPVQSTQNHIMPIHIHTRRLEIEM